MKKLLVFLVAALLVLPSANLLAQQKEAKKAPAKTEKVSQPAIWNTVCPVMGEDVDKTVATATYKDKTIGFCCKSCVKKFNKDPEKYMKNVSADGKKFTKPGK